MFATGESLGGSWFEARLKEAVEAANSAEPEQTRLVKELLSRLVKK